MIELVRAVIERIPEGRVATYGDIAELSRAPSARLVGRVLAMSHEELPWQRVLRADGTCAPHIADEQLARLRAEGVLSFEGKVDLRQYRWEEAAPQPQKSDQPGLWD